MTGASAQPSGCEDTDRTHTDLNKFHTQQVSHALDSKWESRSCCVYMCVNARCDVREYLLMQHGCRCTLPTLVWYQLKTLSPACTSGGPSSLNHPVEPLWGSVSLKAKGVDSVSTVCCNARAEKSVQGVNCRCEQGRVASPDPSISVH